MIEYNGEQVTIMACSNCNANCKHCYISYDGNLTGEQLFEMCKSFSGKYRIILNGTELLIHDDYFDALKISNQKRILTNGIIIYHDDLVLKKLSETAIKNVAMSYHFDSKVSAVPHYVVEESIRKLKNHGFNPELMCTVTAENYNKLEYMCERCVEMGVETLRLFNCLNTGKCKEGYKLILTDYQIIEFFENLQKVREKYDKNVLKIKRNGTFGNCKNNPNFRCVAGIDEVVITPDGNVYPCIYMAKKGYEIGKYIDGKIYIYNKIENDGTMCIAKDIYNDNGLEFSQRVRK